MATSLGSMVLELSANVAQFQSDMGRAAHIAQEQADKIKRTLLAVGGALGVGFSASAFTSWIGGAIGAQDAAIKLAQKIGVATDAVAGLNSAAQKSGIEQQSFQNAMVKLTSGAAQAANGVAKYSLAYTTLGISVKDASGQVKSSDTLLAELADKFSQYKDGATKTAAAVALFGKAGADMIPLLNGGSAAIQHQIDLTKQLGVAIGSDAAKGAEKFNDTMSDLKLVSQGVANQIATALLPALNDFADAAMKFFTSDTWKQWLANIKSAFAWLTENIGKIVDGIKLIGTIAAEYIGARMVAALALATWNMGALVVATIAANSAAAEMGMSFGSSIAASVKQIGVLNLALGTVGAAIAGWQIGTYLYDQFAIVQKGANNFFAALDAGWTVLSTGAQVAWLEIEKAFYVALDSISARTASAIGDMAASFAKIPDALGGGKLAAQFSALAASIAPTRTNVAGLDAQIKALSDGAATSLKVIAGTWNEDNTATKAAAESTTKAGDAAKGAMANIAGLTDGTDKATQSAQKLADMIAKSAQRLSDLQGKISPVARIYSDFASAIIQNNAAYEKEMALATAVGASEAQLLQIKQLLVASDVAALAARDQSIASMQRELDIVGQMKLKNDDALKTLNLSGAALEEATELRYAADAALQQYNNHRRASPELTAAETAAINKNADAFYAQKEAAGLAMQAARDWQSIWTSAGNSVADTFSKVLVEGGSLFNGLKDLAKQTVEQIIAYFLKLQIINPILNSIFGGALGFSMMPTGANAASVMMGGGQGSGIIGSLFSGMFGGDGSSGAAGATGSSGGGLLGSLFGTSQSTGMLSSIFGSTSGSGSGLMGWLFGGSGAQTLNGTGMLTNLGGTQGILGSGGSAAIGTVASVAGGAIAGWQLGSKIGGTAGGIAGAVGLGIAAYMIPVVGWIAGIASLVNMISGGKLFGTSASPIGGDMTTNVGPGGAVVSNVIHEKGQRALFGGSYYKDVAGTVDPAAQSAADAFFASLESGTQAFAKQFGVIVSNVVGGSFVQSYDKDGKPTTTSSTVLGVTYAGETQQQFAERLQADSFLAVLDKMGIGASAFVAGVQMDADQLFAAVQDVASAAQAAQADIKGGANLLGLGASIGDVMAEVMKLSDGVGTLAATYAYIEQATQALRADLELSGVDIGKTGAALVEFADAAAKAAGGSDKLANLIAQFDQAFYTPTEIAQASISKLTDTVNREFGAIGQNSSESMADFKANFLAALPTMTPEQLALWYQAGVDFANLTSQVGQLNDAAQKTADDVAAAAATLLAAQQQYADYQVSMQGDAFTQSLVKIVEQEKANIDSANALARAAGLAGASQKDLAAIIAQGTAAMGQALANLVTSIQQDIATLVGPVADIGPEPTSDGTARVLWKQQKADADAASAKATAAADQASKMGAAYDLIQKLGDYSFISGKSSQDTLDAFTGSTSLIAQTLGLSPDDIKAQIEAQANSDAALTKIATQAETQTGLLENILAAIQGKALPFDVGSLAAPTVYTAAGGKTAPPPVATLPPGAMPSSSASSISGDKTTGDVVTAVTSGSRDTNSLLRDLIVAVRQSGGVGALVNRNTRPALPVFAR